MTPTRRDVLAAGAAAPLAASHAHSAPREVAGAPAYVDAAGVLRWRADGREVAIFGVNYGLPSASAFRYARAAGADIARTIADDLLHLRRLGLDALRLSFWGDWEASTPEGDLVESDQLRALDELVAQAGRAGFHMLLSPIVTYDASWPDALGRPRSGLMSRFQKDRLGLDADAVAAQVRYLGQLMARRNPRTGLTYAADPAILAVEPINEPTHHPEDAAQSVRYMEALAAAVRGAGSAKPVVFNVSQDLRIADALARSSLEGATFAWYPTGLSARREVEGNGLLLVDDYAQMRDPRLRSKARLVYEFDAADTMHAYMYPAMARAFRSGGAQFAAMFSYDALPIAAGNLEFNDHFLNLCHTPAKALSMLIAGEAFRRLPRGAQFGLYPLNMSFGPFRVDDVANASEMVTDTVFLHANDTGTTPRRPAALQRLAGVGSSPVVTYDGTGAWFLDRLAPGAWRLEVYPDAVVVADPFDVQTPGRVVSRIVHRARSVRLRLPDLGDAFLLEPVGWDAPSLAAKRGEVLVTPGVWLLRRDAGVARPAVDARFVAPPPTGGAAVVLHDPPDQVVAGRDLALAVQVVADAPPHEVRLHVRRGGGGFTASPLQPGRGFDHTARIAAAELPAGVLEYFVSVAEGGRVTTHPGAIPVSPQAWNFPLAQGWRTVATPPDADMMLFDAARDADRMTVPYGGYEAYPGVRRMGGPDLQHRAVRLDGEVAAASPQQDVSLQVAHDAPLDFVGRPAAGYSHLVLRGRCVGGAGRAAVILVERDGSAWGAAPRLPTVSADVPLPLSELRPVRAAMLPRDFPKGVNPYWLRSPNFADPGRTLRLDAVQAVQLSVGPRFLKPGEATGVVEVESVRLSTSAG